MPEYYLKSGHGPLLPNLCNSSDVTAIWLCLVWSTGSVPVVTVTSTIATVRKMSHPRLQKFWVVCQGRNQWRGWLTSVWSEDDQRRISVIISVNLWCPVSFSLLVQYACSIQVWRVKFWDPRANNSQHIHISYGISAIFLSQQLELYKPTTSIIIVALPAFADLSPFLNFPLTGIAFPSAL
jgi:hypothetical protein